MKTVPWSMSSSCKSSIVEGVHITTYKFTMHVRHVVSDRTYSRRSWTSAKRRRSLARYDHYDGEMPDNDRWTSVASLKSTRWRTGSQCSWRSNGVMWSERRVGLPVTRQATAFWTDCNRFNREHIVAVAQATGDERLDQCFTRIFRQWSDSLP